MESTAQILVFLTFLLSPVPPGKCYNTTFRLIIAAFNKLPIKKGWSLDSITKRSIPIPVFFFNEDQIHPPSHQIINLYQLCIAALQWCMYTVQLVKHCMFLLVTSCTVTSELKYCCQSCRIGRFKILFHWS